MTQQGEIKGSDLLIDIWCIRDKKLQLWQPEPSYKHNLWHRDNQFWLWDENLKGKASILGITTPLHTAVLSSHFLYKNNIDTSYAEKILQELIKKGAFVSAQDENGKTPLHIAAEYNHLYAARLLLKSGTKVMPKDKKGKTPLDYAESAEMIKLLKEHGAKEL